MCCMHLPKTIKLRKSREVHIFVPVDYELFPSSIYIIIPKNLVWVACIKITSGVPDTFLSIYIARDTYGYAPRMQCAVHACAIRSA